MSATVRIGFAPEAQSPSPPARPRDVEERRAGGPFDSAPCGRSAQGARRSGRGEGGERAAQRPPWTVFALAALVALTPACRRIPPPDLPADPAVLLGEVVKAQGAVWSVQGEARVKVDAGGFYGTLKHFIAAEKPDKVHLETLDFFGNVVAVLAAGGDRFALYDAREKVFYRGRPTPENLARILPLALDTPSLVTILCGSAPILEGTPVEVAPGSGVVRLVLDGGARRQALELGPGAAVESSRVRLAGADGAITDAPPPGALDLRFEEFRTRAGARFPTDLEIVSRDPAAELDVHWTDVEVNGTVDADLFVLEPPRGARVVDLEDRG